MKYDASRRPSPEMLAGYVDGELDARGRAVVERWLARDKDARADVDAQRRIGTWWRLSDPKEPDEAAYRETLLQIETRLLVPVAARPGRQFRLPWIIGFAAAAAVAATVLMTLANGPGGSSPGPAPVSIEEGPWPVASADDVFISSIANAEEDPILIGDPPIRDGIALARPGEIDLMGMIPEPGLRPRIPRDDETIPIIFTEPAAAVPDRKLP
jgi:hypothetical protein